ncbi:hypothetical protein HK102_004444 [Quaeritorhiza haematococci]|nr:hypothetical protein HK102_004444 [Quaeritorhiza haematococci]
MFGHYLTVFDIGNLCEVFPGLLHAFLPCINLQCISDPDQIVQANNIGLWTLYIRRIVIEQRNIFESLSSHRCSLKVLLHRTLFHHSPKMLITVSESIQTFCRSTQPRITWHMTQTLSQLFGTAIVLGDLDKINYIQHATGTRFDFEHLLNTFQTKDTRVISYVLAHLPQADVNWYHVLYQLIKINAVELAGDFVDASKWNDTMHLLARLRATKDQLHRLQSAYDVAHSAAYDAGHSAA